MDGSLVHGQECGSTPGERAHAVDLAQDADFTTIFFENTHAFNAASQKSVFREQQLLHTSPGNVIEQDQSIGAQSEAQQAMRGCDPATLIIYEGHVANLAYDARLSGPEPELEMRIDQRTCEWRGLPPAGRRNRELRRQGMSANCTEKPRKAERTRCRAGDHLAVSVQMRHLPVPQSTKRDLEDYQTVIGRDDLDRIGFGGIDQPLRPVLVVRVVDRGMLLHAHNLLFLLHLLKRNVGGRRGIFARKTPRVVATRTRHMYFGRAGGGFMQNTRTARAPG